MTFKPIHLFLAEQVFLRVGLCADVIRCCTLIARSCEAILVFKRIGAIFALVGAVVYLSAFGLL